jgi:hypothetical protein
LCSALGGSRVICRNLFSFAIMSSEQEHEEAPKGTDEILHDRTMRDDEGELEGPSAQSERNLAFFAKFPELKHMNRLEKFAYSVIWKKVTPSLLCFLFALLCICGSVV